MPTAAEHRVALQALLPTGPAWPRAEENLLTRLLSAISQEFGRLDTRAGELADEIDPSTSTELLDAWELVLGLPDPCTAAAIAADARRLSAVRKLSFAAGQTRAFYIALAASIGFAIEIHEFDQDVDDYDSGLTALITDERWRFVWRVHVLSEVDYTVFRVGTGRAGDLLATGGALDLECIITAAKPAHTHVIFTYPEP